MQSILSSWFVQGMVKATSDMRLKGWKAHGAHNYAIWLDAERNLLLACVEIESEARWAAVAETEVWQRWWTSMKALMPSHADNSPVSSEMKQVFFLE